MLITQYLHLRHFATLESHHAGAGVVPGVNARGVDHSTLRLVFSLHPTRGVFIVDACSKYCSRGALLTHVTLGDTYRFLGPRMRGALYLAHKRTFQQHESGAR